MVRVEIRGREFTRRLVTVHEGGGETWEMRKNRVSLRTLSDLRAEALQVIRDVGIEPECYLQESSYGSRLREAVINFHEYSIDSIEGLAARIYECAAHVQGYRELGEMDSAIDMMGQLGGLVALFDVYLQVSTATSKAGKKGVKLRPKSKAEDIIEMADALKAEGKSERDIGAIIANRLDVSARWVRQIRKRKRN